MKIKRSFATDDRPTSRQTNKAPADLNSLLYQRAAPGIIAQLFVAVFLVIALYPLVKLLYLLAWLSVVAGLSAALLYLCRDYHCQSRHFQQDTRLKLFALLTFFIGSSWGFVNIAFMPSVHLPYQSLIVLLIFGLSAGAAIFLSPLLYALFLLPATLPFILWSFFQGGAHILLGLSSLMYVLALIGASYYIRYFLQTPLLLQHQNRALDFLNRSLATHDLLTGLPNKPMMLEHLHKGIAYAKRFHSSFFVFCVNIDNLKTINSNFSHDTGDEVLKKIARRLAKNLRKTDVIARLGGDEFIVLFSANSIKSLHHLAEKLLRQINRPLKIRHHHLIVTASIGISVYPKDGKNASTLLKNAAIAMHVAKNRGKNNFTYFEEKQNNSRSQKRMRLQLDLYHALQQNDFFLLFQPVVTLKSANIVATEALVRWRHPREGILLPEEFIPLAEESGMIIPLGQWIFYQACQQNKAWQNAGLKPIRMAVNVSAVQLRSRDFIDFVEQALRDTQLEPQYLEIELTESSLIDNTRLIQDSLQYLHEKGLSIVIDDFGIGYSSINYIRQFPVNKLKIDSSFVSECMSNPEDASIIKAILAMAKSLNLEVIAEGIENHAQRQFLIRCHCQEGQGFLFSPPVEEKALARLIEQESLQVPTHPCPGNHKRKSV